MATPVDDKRPVDLAHAQVPVAGLPLHYVSAGEGPPVVLVHGQGENWATWQRVIPALARTRRVYAIDLPGAGDSGRQGRIAEPTSFYSDLLAGFLDQLGLADVALVGNSHGGLVSLRLALAGGGRVARLCLVDSAALGRETNPLLIALSLPVVGELASAWCSTHWGAAQFTWMLAQVSFSQPHRIPTAWYENVARLARTPGHLREGVIAAVRSHLGAAGQREILLEELPRLDMPTLLVWGAEDRVVPWRHGADAVGRLKHGKLVVIPDCGHLPQVEQPEAFVAALLAFLDAARGDDTGTPA